jgi:hypothetical protein
MQSESPKAAPKHDRSIVIRDMLVFQFKLIVDGVLDLVLLPVSLLVGLVSVIGSGPKSGGEFYDLMRAGRRAERWINLFGSVERGLHPGADEGLAARDLDDLVSRVEAFVLDEYRNRGGTVQTRQRLDAALESLRRLGKQDNPRKPD